MDAPKTTLRSSALLLLLHAPLLPGCNTLLGLDAPTLRSDAPDAQADAGPATSLIGELDASSNNTGSSDDGRSPMDASSMGVGDASDSVTATLSDGSAASPATLDGATDNAGSDAGGDNAGSDDIGTATLPLDAAIATTGDMTALDAGPPRATDAGPKDTGSADASLQCTADACSPAPECPEGYTGDGITCTPRSCQDMPPMCGLDEQDDCCASLAVPEGDFFRGISIKYPAEIAAFKLDKYEVTVGRFRKFADAYEDGWRPQQGDGAHPFIQHSGWDPIWDEYMPETVLGIADELHCSAPQAPNLDTWSASGRNDTQPLNCLTWYHAFAFCVWDGGRLPTETEWEYTAGGGKDELEYVWGNDIEPNEDLAVYGCVYTDGENICTVYDILPVGSKPLGVAKFGHMDMAGSLWEWALDFYSEGGFDGPCDNCANLATEDASRVIRGGAYDGDASLLLTTFRSLNTPAYGSPSVGLRCARAL